jgi:large subunit ribosomal protein L6
MSRIGEQEVTIKEGVTVSKEGSIISVRGPLGEINITIPEGIDVEVKENSATIVLKGETKQDRSNYGTYRMLLSNAVEGVKDGFTKTLELVGVGYRARMEGNKLVMSLGLNHPVEMEPEEGIQIEVPEETKIIIKGFNKQKVGEFAAKIRELKKPEPYKGKGIRYENEYIRRKSSKSNLGSD